jgi:surfeit locus 1 family protein
MSFRARLLVIAFFGIVALVCARLGVWQMDRLRERRGANLAALQARAAPPVRLGGKTAIDATLEGRRVAAAGHYDHTHDIVLRGKVYQGVPGVEIVSPLLLEGRRMAVLVNRGFVPAPDAVTVESDSVRELGRVQVAGTALPLLAGRGAPLQRGRHTTWAQLDRDALAAGMPYELAPIYIRQSPDSALPRFPRRLDPPVIDDGPHRNYAIQWFAFAVMAVVFGVVIFKTKSVSGER